MRTGAPTRRIITAKKRWSSRPAGWTADGLSLIHICFENIRLLVLDVDGTMTDGGVYIDNNRVESKRFSIKDGAGILMAKAAGIDVMILTGRESNCVAQRASELGIQLIFQNVKAKMCIRDRLKTVSVNFWRLVTVNFNSNANWSYPADRKYILETFRVAS